MSVSFGVAFVFYSRIRLRWLRDYLVYLVCYAAWLLFSTYFFFQAVYLPFPVAELSFLAVVLRVLVLLIILYAGPLFALRIAGLKVGRREWWLLSIPVAFVFGTVLVFYATGSERVAIIPNGVFNLYLGALFAVASIRVFSSARKDARANALRLAFLPVLWLSVGAYAVLLAANIISVAVPGLVSASLLDVGLASVYCLGWSLIAIIMFAARLRVIAPPVEDLATGRGVPGGFMEAFELTEREHEITEDLVTGIQSNAIADRYFISPHTVDAHIADIYRKCGVTNRVELMRLVERYRVD